MKTNKILVMALLLAVSGGTFTSCAIKDNEKHSEMVEDPIQATTEYYINGKVVTEVNSTDTPLAEVTIDFGNNQSVKTDATGNFSLTVNETGSYALAASKDGYLKMTGTVIVPEDATNRSSYNTSFIMTKKATAVTIAADNTAPVVINNGSRVDNMNDVVSGVAVNIPAETENIKGAEISVTEYVPEVSATNVAAEEVPVANIYVEAPENIPANGITLAVANQATNDNESFEAMAVYKSTVTRSGDNFEKIGDANLSSSSNKYEIQLTGGNLAGDYSFRVKYNSTATTGKETVSGKEDNSGSLNAIKNYKISYKEKTGWEYTDKTQLDALDNSETKKMIENAIKACEGAEGVVETTKSMTTNISGNHLLHYTVENNYTVTTYKFVMKSGKNITVKTKAYTGTKLSYQITSADQHSGGTANGI